MTAATLMHHHRVVRAALNQAKRWKYIPQNPADDVQLDSGGRTEMHVPTAVQARALVLQAAGTFSPDLGPILLFAMLTGLRRGNYAGSNGQWLVHSSWCGLHEFLSRTMCTTEYATALAKRH